MAHGPLRFLGLGLLLAVAVLGACKGGSDAPGRDGGGSGGAGAVDAGTCQNSLDCVGSPGRPICDSTTRRCVGCATQADCPNGQCVANQCVDPTQGCQNSTDCTGMAGRPICDRSTGRCVQCLAVADCPMSNDCLNQACVPYQSCVNSLGCSAGQVCDTTRMRCVECVGSNDCPPMEICSGNVCRTRCMSDNQCTPMGMLCNTSLGHCVTCVVDSDCRPEQYCSAGSCLADVCTAGLASCQNNNVVTCSANGGGVSITATCSTAQSCMVTAGVPSCRNQICSPNVTMCDAAAGSERLVRCSADGFSTSTISDCAAQQQVCVGGVCHDVICPRAMRYCSGTEVRQCSAKGDSWTLVQTCVAGTQFCDTATMSCRARVCTPSTPACSGNIATTCNADGSGYATGGTDCGTLFCSGGACINAILKENFEDGNYDGWTVGTTATTYTRTVVAGGAVDTGYALSMGNTSTTGALDGLYRVFSPGIQPKSVSWWTKTPASSSNYDSCFRLSGSTAPTTTSTADVIMYVCFYRTSMYRYLSGTTTTTTHTPGVWVLLELRNIDWTAKTLDFYVNNTIVQQAARFYSTTPTSLQRIDLYTWSGVSGQLSYWDEIELLP